MAFKQVNKKVAFKWVNNNNNDTDKTIYTKFSKVTNGDSKFFCSPDFCLLLNI